MINKSSRRYIRAKLAIIQLRCEQIDEELQHADDQVNRPALRILLGLLLRESEQLHTWGMTNNKKPEHHMPGPESHDYLLPALPKKPNR